MENQLKSNPNIAIVNNSEESFEFNPEEYIARYIKGEDKVTGKPKTPEEEIKSKADKGKTNQEIKLLLNIEREFDTLDVAKNKINEFIS